MDREQLPINYRYFPEHWKVLPFDQVFEDKTGGQVKIKKGDYLHTGLLPIVDQGQNKYSGFTNDFNHLCKINLPCILFGDHTKLFKFIEKPFALGADGVKVLKQRDDINPKFAYYYLSKLKLPDVGYSRHFRFLKRTFFPLPPIEEQKRIAEILDRADEIRQKRKRAIALTEQLARSTFLDMFGDPVTNPKGWEVEKIGNFGKVITGNTPPRSNPQNYGDQIEWIKSDNITTPYHFLTQASEKLSKQGKEKARVVPPESILVTCIAGSKSSIGKVGIANREVAFNQQINAVIPDSDINPYFLYAHFLICQNLVQAQSTDSMKGLVSKNKFCNIIFLNPPYNKQCEFGNWFLKFYQWTQHLQSYYEYSNNLFNSLLQRAFKGEL
jgi:type I restriction enzyme S subunit